MADTYSLRASYKRSLPFLGTMRVTSLYGARWWNTSEGYVQKMHYGMDIVGVSDKTVVSVTTGVVKVISGKTGFGNHVWVWNEDGTTSIYAHLASYLCKEGQKVDAKTPIGIMGSTGHSTGPHLHIGMFEGHVLKEDKNAAFDPAIYLHLESLADTKSSSDRWLNGSGYISLTKSTQAYSSQQALEAGEEEEQQYFPTVIESTQENASDYSKSISFSDEYYQVQEGSTQYLDVLYGRRYRILVAFKDGTALDVSGLRCTFEITRSWTNFSAMSTVTIYNLSAKHENKIITDADTVYVEAGYSGKSTYGLIYKGKVIQPIRAREGGVDYSLTLLMANAAEFNTQAILGVTINSNANMRTVVNEVVNKSGNLTNTNYGLNVGKLTDQSTAIKLPRGKVLFGRSSRILDQIATSLNSTAYVEDGNVNIISPELVGNGTIFDVGPDSGLLASPTQTTTGVQITTLLNPRFELNNLFHIDNSILKTQQYSIGSAMLPLDTQGIYRIVEIVHRGDTRGKEWSSQITAMSQIGALPTAALNIHSSIGV